LPTHILSQLSFEIENAIAILCRGSEGIAAVMNIDLEQNRFLRALEALQQMGVESGLQYASIESWVELKISSGRQKDQAHIVEVLKKSVPSTIESIQRHLADVHTLRVSMTALFLRIHPIF